MRAAVVQNSHEVVLGEVPEPEPGPGEVRLRIEACGICGTDLHCLHAGLLPDGHTPGHEMAGRVDALGEGVEGVALDARVAVEPLRTCGECEYCQRGDFQLCRSMATYGIHMRGGLAEKVCVPAMRLFPAPEALRAELCALAEPIAVAVHGLRRGGVREGQRVLVLGAGAVGLASTLAARAVGAEVFVSARHAHQAAMAAHLGATRVLAESELAADRLHELTGKLDFDVVVETVGGSADTLITAGGAVRPGGTVAVLGLFLARTEIEPLPLLLKEATLAWSNCYSRTGQRADFETALSIISDERERLERFASHTVPLDRITEAFRLAGDKKAGVLKVSVAP